MSGENSDNFEKVYATGSQLDFLNRSTTEGDQVPEALNSYLNDSALSDAEWYDDPTMAAMMFLDGVTFGFSDEMAAGASAAMSVLAGSDKDYASLYSDTVINMEAERNAYQAQFPVASMALNVAGGLALAPFSMTGNLARVAGAGVTAASRLAPTATKALAQATSGISPAVSSVISRVAPVAAPLAEIGATGALAGVGYAQQGADLEQAAIDGLTSALYTGVALKGLGKTVDIASRQRVARNLRTEQGFESLNIIGSNGTLEKLYRGVVKDLPLAKGLIATQNKKFIAPLESRVKEGEARVSMLRDKNNLNAYLGKEEAFAAKLLKDQEAKASKGLTESQKLSTQKIADQHNTVLAAQTAKINQRLIDATKEFRIKAFDSSMPASAGVVGRAKILSKPNTNDAFSELSQTWTNKGFEVIKSKNFTLDPQLLMEKIRTRVGAELDDAEVLYGLKPAEINNMIGTFITKNLDEKGVISGKSVQDLRNKISSSAYTKSDNLKQVGVAQVNRKILDELNSAIKSQLSPSQQKMLAQDMSSYQHFITLTDAVANASVKGAKGAFDSQQWLTALKRNTGARKFSAGQGVLYKEANELNGVASDVAAQTKKAADISGVLQKTKIEAAIGVVNKEASDLNKKFMNEKLINMDVAKAEYEAAMKMLAKNTEELQQLKTLMPNKASSISNYTPAVVMVGLAQAVDGGFSGGSAAATGAAIGKFLGSEFGQTLLAGQTQAQRAVAAGLQKSRGATSRIGAAAQRETVRQESSDPNLQEKLMTARIGSPSAKAALFRQLSVTGELERLRSVDSASYKALEEAWRAQSQN